MPSPTKITITFDNGTYYEIDPTGISSIFIDEPKAKKCGKKKFGPPPQDGPVRGPFSTTTSVASTTASVTDTAAGSETANAMGDSCYWVDGVIVCP